LSFGISKPVCIFAGRSRAIEFYFFNRKIMKKKKRIRSKKCKQSFKSKRAYLKIVYSVVGFVCYLCGELAMEAFKSTDTANIIVEVIHYIMLRLGL